MAQCAICGKKRTIGHHVSHANNKTKRPLMPNLQRIRIVQNGSTQKTTVCTRCIRSGLITKAA